MKGNNRNIVKAAAALLFLTVLFSLSGCLKIVRTETPETAAPEMEEPAPPPAPETEPPVPDKPEGPPEIDFTLDEIRDANTLTVLLSRYRCATMRTESDGGVSYTYTFWNQDGRRFSYLVSTYADIYEEYDTGETAPAASGEGMYRGLSFTADPQDGVTADIWLPDLRTEEEREAEDNKHTEYFLVGYLPQTQDGGIRLLSYDEGTVTVEIDELLDYGEDGSVPCVNRITLDRETLAVRAAEWEADYGDGEIYGGAVTVEYDGEKPEGAVSAAEDWEGTRTVTFEVVTENLRGTCALTVPGRWQLRLSANDGIYIGTDPALPGGNGQEWVGADTGSVTVWVRDEANLPIDVPDDPEEQNDPEVSGTDGNRGLNAGSAEVLLGFTFDELIEANRITNLTRKYGTVTTLQHGDIGDTLTSFFRHGEEIVLYTEASNDYGGVTETVKYGSVGGDADFSLFDGGISLSTYPGGVYTDPEVRTTNAGGEYYMYDLYLAGSVLAEGEISGVKTGDGTVSFTVTEVLGAEGDYTVTYSYVVDAESLLLLEIGSETAGWVLTVTVGEEIPFRREFESAFADTREVLCHAQLNGKEGDYLYTVPASWSFFLTVSEESASFTADPEGLIPFENFIPPDGKAYEFWVSDAKG